MGAPNLATIGRAGVTAGKTITPTLPIVILNTPNSGKSLRVNQIVVTNNSAAAVTVTVSLFKSSWYRFLPSITVLPFNTIELISKSIYLEEDCKIAIVPSVDNVINASISYDDISDSAAVVEYLDTETRTTILSLTSESSSLLFNADLSLNNTQLTPVGGVQPANINPYRGKYYSIYFNGSTDYLSIPNSSDLILAGNAWTIEMWVFLTGDRSKYRTIITKRVTNTNTTSYQVYTNITTGVLAFYNGTEYLSTSVVPLNEWAHIACVYTGSNIVLYLNGVQVLNTPVTISEVNEPIVIGYTRASSTTWFEGYISDLRVVKGTQVYTGNFTPPVEPLTAISKTVMLLCNSNRFIDSSATNSIVTIAAGTPKITQLTPYKFLDQYASTYFDGSTGYLSVPNSTSMVLAGTTWTIDGWIYLTSDKTTYRTIIAKRVSGTGTTSYEIYIRLTTGVLSFYNGTNYESATVVPMYCWTHIAGVYNGTNIVLYMNGNQVLNTAVSITEQDQPVVIGTARGYSEYFGGYISSMRVVKGSVLYTANFIPPELPSQVISGTSLLTCVGSAHSKNIPYIDTSVYKSLVLPISNPSLSTANPYGTNWSAHFNGSSDYTLCDGNSGLALGTGDFTIEFWMYPFTVTGYPVMIDFRPASTNGLYPTIDINASSYVEYYTNNGVRILSNSTVSAYKWYHVSIVRSSNITSMFINGVKQTSTYADTNNYTVGASRPIIGGAGSNATVGNNMYTGYLADIRIVKGTAVYTANFTPPVAPLSAIANTSLLLCNSNRFADSSTTNSTITVFGTPKIVRYSPYVNLTQTYNSATYRGSSYFNGANYINASSNPGLNFGTGDFTIEFWVYSTAATSTIWNPIFTIGINGGGKEIRIAQNVNGTGQCGFLVPATTTTDMFTGTTIGVLPKFEWTHLALVRNGSTVTFYKNGVSKSSLTGQTFTFSGGDARLGNGWYTGDGYFTGGYISDLRVVKGTAVYTANFTPPVSPLSEIPNTSLMIASTPANGSIAMSNTSITNMGDSLITSVAKYSGNNAMYFDGAGDYLLLTDMQPGYLSGDFTVEAWCNCTTALAQSVFSGSYRSFLVTLNRTLGKVGLHIGNGSTWAVVDYSSTGSFTSNMWNHIAVTKSGTTFTIYINGVANGTVTGTPSGYTQVAWIGMYNSTEYYNGYIDNFRFVVGTPLYTGNFTPPTRIVNL